MGGIGKRKKKRALSLELKFGREGDKNVAKKLSGAPTPRSKLKA